MSEQQTPDEIEQTAVQAVTDADTALADLETRVIAGEVIDPADIERARTQRHVAGLQLEGARKRAEQLRTEQAAAKRQQAIGDAAADLDAHSFTEITAKYAAADAAVRDLITACLDRNTAIRQAHQRLRPHGDCERLQVSDATHGRAPYVVIDGQQHQTADSLVGPLVRYLLQRAGSDFGKTTFDIPGGESVTRALGNSGMLHPPRAAGGR
ncbi:hypothetical protein [Streptomyces coelicoflavus]|uniref:hypothetical protein n=1 Tax=Streptomyces coelicoflavus TaxID=285562 RepID=UPI000D59FF41|nr:hypothetical protein [Streptomyces coelicoflavus]